jgi:hypothetical protein
VLTNSAAYAGFSFFSVPVVDLNISSVVLSGKHVSWKIRLKRGHDGLKVDQLI